MSKNIVVFSDGTGQDGGVRPDQRLSNIYKLYRATRVGPDNDIDPARQVAFYDPGLGTDSDTHGWTRARRTIGKALASVAGRGIATNIIDCYEFILNHWRPGDRIFLIGFSRGAYTVRCVAQVLSLCGVPVHDEHAPDRPFTRFARSTRKVASRAVHEVYEHGAGFERGLYEAERDELARRFRVAFGSDEDGLPNASAHFVGVFDTVAALGAKGAKQRLLQGTFVAAGAGISAAAAWPASLLLGTGWRSTAAGLFAGGSATAWALARRNSRRSITQFPDAGSPARTHHIAWHADNYDRGLSGHVGYARQASAIDEDRADFPRVAWGKKDIIRKPSGDEPPPLVQLWFAGNHSDIGGSYPEVESRLSDVALEWMVEEATSVPGPLLVDRSKLQLWPDATGMQHSEITSAQEDLLWWVPCWAPATIRQGWRAEKRKAQGGVLHPSVHERFAATAVQQAKQDIPYRPANLSEDARFAHLYGTHTRQTQASAERLQATGFIRLLDQSRCLSLNANESSNSVASYLTECQASDATLILAGPWTADERDPYHEALNARHLAKLAGQTGARWHAVEYTITDGDPLEHPRPGILLLDWPADKAEAMALASGTPRVLAINGQVP